MFVTETLRSCGINIDTLFADTGASLINIISTGDETQQARTSVTCGVVSSDDNMLDSCTTYATNAEHIAGIVGLECDKADQIVSLGEIMTASQNADGRPICSVPDVADRGMFVGSRKIAKRVRPIHQNGKGTTMPKN